MPRGKRNEVYWAAHGDLVIRKGGGHFGHRSPRLMYPHVTRFRDHLLLLLFTASLLIAVLAQRKFPCGLLSCTYPSLHGTVLAENCLNQDTGGEITAHLLSISLFPSLTSSSKSSVAQEIFKKQAYYSSSASFTSTRPPRHLSVATLFKTNICHVFDWNLIVIVQATVGSQLKPVLSPI